MLALHMLSYQGNWIPNITQQKTSLRPRSNMTYRSNHNCIIKKSKPYKRYCIVEEHWKKETHVWGVLSNACKFIHADYCSILHFLQFEKTPIWIVMFEITEMGYGRLFPCITHHTATTSTLYTVHYKNRCSCYRPS